MWPPHNHQTVSVQIKPPLDVDLFGTDFDLHSPNRFGVDVTNPVSHLIYTFECESMRITFASVDRPLVCAIVSILICGKH